MANTLTLSNNSSSPRKIDEAQLTGRSADSSLPSTLISIEERLISGSIDSPAALALITDAIADVPGISGAMIALREGTDVVCCASSGIALPVGTRTDSTSGLCGECLLSGRMVRSEETTANPRVDVLADGNGPAIILPLPRGSGILAVFSTRVQGNEHLTAFGTAATLASLIAGEEKKRTAEGNHVEPAPQRFHPEASPIENVSGPDVALDRNGVDDLMARVQEIQRLALTSSRQGDIKELATRARVRPKVSSIALTVALITLCWVGVFTYSLRRSHAPATLVRIAPPSHAAFTVNEVVGAPTLAGATHGVKPSEISGGRLLQQRELIYPPTAITNGIQGEVSAVLVVDETGVVSDVLISSGDSTLAQSAVAPLSHWRYSPFKVNGRPVAVNVPVTISFCLNR